MKKLLFLFLLIPIISQAQWVQLNSNTTKHLNAVAFTSVDTGYVVGWNGTILKTIDGGDNWIDLSLNNDWDLADVCFPAKDTGYIYGAHSNGFGQPGAPVINILKTTDGGANWILQDSIIAIDTIVGSYHGGIDFLDVNTGVIVGYGNYIQTLILFTNDGGTTWRDISLLDIPQAVNFAPLHDVAIYDSTHAVAVGVGNAYHSFVISDTSLIWNCISEGQGGMSNSLNSVCFADSNTVFTAGQHGFIHKVINNDWIGRTTYTIDTTYVNSISFPTPDTGYLIGGFYKTIDNGNNWFVQYYPTSQYSLRDMFFIDCNNGFIVGANGVIFKTTNGGVSNFEEFSLKDDIEIYPNPFTDEVRIKTLNKKDYTYKIISTEGRVLKTGKIKHEIEKINLQAIDSKILLIKILDNNKKIICTRKLIKEN